jgi:hypothetical protein
MAEDAPKTPQTYQTEGCEELFAKCKCKKDFAHANAKMGFSVFPVVPNEKRPAISGWQNLAATDPEKIEKWWDENPDYNIGIKTGGVLAVIDADVKNGARGLESLEIMGLEWLDPSFTVDSPSGGRHVYLYTDQEVRGGVKHLADYPGIDIQGEAKLIVGVGSTINGKSYSLASGVAVNPAPEEFYEVVKKKKAAHKRVVKNTRRPNNDNHRTLDTKSNISRAIRWVVNEAPEAISELNGDDAAYQTAAGCKDFGLSQQMTLAVMVAKWSPIKAFPPFSKPADLAMLQDKVANAYHYGQNIVGSSMALADFEELEVEEDDPNLQARREVRAGHADTSPKYSIKDIDERADAAFNTPQKPLIEGVLEQEKLVVFFGSSGVGKTFAALDMANAIATGNDWFGRKTVQSSVYYFAAEGEGGLNIRLAALRKSKGSDAKFFKTIVGGGADFFRSDDDALEITRIVNETAKIEGHVPGLVVIDTMAMTIGDGDENTAQDMTKYINRANIIRSLTGATVMIIHHTGKTEKKGLRGSSALIAAVDTAIELKSHTNNQKISLTTPKQRDQPKLNEPLEFVLKNVFVGMDCNGKQLNSCVVMSANDVGLDVAEIDLSSRPQEFLDTLKTLEILSPSDPVSTGEWFDGYRTAKNPRWMVNDQKSEGCSDSSLKRMTAELVSSGLVKSVGHGRYLSG